MKVLALIPGFERLIAIYGMFWIEFQKTVISDNVKTIVIYWATMRTFQPLPQNFSPKKLKKNRYEKISYIFSKKEFFLIFWEMELASHKSKKIQEEIFQDRKIKKSL